MEDKDKSWFEELLIKGDKLQTFVGENRQKGIDTAAQKVDDVVTDTLQDWNVPGAQFIGDRARNITGLAADLYTPEAWEIPFYIGTQVEPSPLGEAAIYGAGRINKARRLLKGVKGKTLTGVKSVVESNLPNITRVIDDVFSTVHKHINGHSVYQEAGTGMPIRVDGKMMAWGADDLSPNVVPGNVPRPLPGSQHVSGMIPRIRGKFNGKQFNNTTLDPNLNIPWNLVRDPQEKGRKIAGFFVDQASDPTAWNRLNNSIKRMMERRFPGWDLPLRRGETPIGGWAGHHSAPVKQMAWSVNGLSNEAREEATNYMAKRIGQRLGYSPENLDAIPAEFHVYIHRMLNDAMGRYDVSNIERIMNLEPGGFSKLELWDRQRGFDLIADNIIQSKKDIYTFMTALANQSKRTDISPEVLVDSMEELLDLQHRIRLKPGDKNLTQIINKFLGRSDAAIDFVEDQLSAAERPIKNILYRLALEDLDKAKAFVRSRRGGTPGGPDLSPGMFPDD